MEKLVESLGITGKETYDLKGLEGEIKPQQLATLVIHRADQPAQESEALGEAAQREQPLQVAPAFPDRQE